MNEIDRAAYGNSFYAATRVEVPPRARLTYELNVDVCVVGAGLAGLTTAREVARRGWSVAVLEAGRVASGATGRNCGFVIPGFAERIDHIVERVGLGHAKALWGLSEAGVEYVRNTIRESETPGVELGKGWLHVSKVDKGDEMLALVQLMGQEFEAAIEGGPTERAQM